MTPTSRTPIDVAVEFINSLTFDNFGSHARETSHLTGFVVKDVHTTAHNGVTHVYMRQTFEGVEIENIDANVNVDQHGSVISYGFSSSATLFRHPDKLHFQILRRADLESRETEPKEAVAALAKFLQLPTENIGYDHWDVTSQSIGLDKTKEASVLIENVPFCRGNSVAVTRKYVRTNASLNVDRLEPVWDFTVDMTPKINSWLHVQVSRRDNSVLRIVDWISDASYRVIPVGVNDLADLDWRRRDFDFPQTAIDLASTDNRMYVMDPERNKVSSPLGWMSLSNSELISTIGNNVDARSPCGQCSGELNTRPEARVNERGAIVFDDRLDLTKDPRESVNASVTNLFYLTNMLHDIFYNYGFDEASGNFQEDNFGRGGLGGDRLIANAQESSGLNNANIAVPPDGVSPRMNMYLWDQTSPFRDGVFDSGIVIHEYGHGVSIRLTGGRLNSGCLAFGESQGLGEGWSDFFATALRMKSQYTRDMSFGMAEYANGGEGIRPYKYSASMTENPQTYGWIRRESYREAHDKGAVWASILYEVYWNLVDTFGFDGDWMSVSHKRRYNISLAGNQVMMQLVIDGLKLQPCLPGFVDARDAIIQADEVGFGGKHVCELWRGFAKRGLGVRAEKRGKEDFTLPVECV